MSEKEKARAEYITREIMNALQYARKVRAADFEIILSNLQAAAVKFLR